MKKHSPSWLEEARRSWINRGGKRPDFAIEPRDEQESVWDYPRPPVIMSDQREVRAISGEELIAVSKNCIRFLETSHPPSFYIPQADIEMSFLKAQAGSSFCEWKGNAQYWQLVAGKEVIDRVGWSYPKPFIEFEAMKDHICFYPGKINCFVDGESVQPQAGGFYGG